jgi:hypothetical protein
MKIIISENQFNKIIKEQNNTSIIDKYVSDKRLRNILYDIEKKTGQKFTEKNFQDEIKISGEIKPEAGRILPEIQLKFSGLTKVCPGLKMDEDSYRTYEKQKDLFIEYVKKYGSIEGAMKLRSIPGYSQHHTGRAIDIEPKEVRGCVAKNANRFGFIFPYVGQTSTRVPEDWHIYYK